MTKGVPKSLPPWRRKPQVGESPLLSLTVTKLAISGDSHYLCCRDDKDDTACCRQTNAMAKRPGVERRTSRVLFTGIRAPNEKRLVSDFERTRSRSYRHHAKRGVVGQVRYGIFLV
ncbi:hypothetical protein GWI33_007028 [Rhynchophorus ferrugineus]|uniref:Uncharacterized protein n=1 Tax=Rhynchophorus ferrugineus TaxID=354439 RepID=A0A834IF42_RHYFE|nr:hypothetical protein GWI33_007028 [Rhynchophorus ferrugineus]